MSKIVTSLFDDGHKTYQAISSFEWDGPVQETPFGEAAYVGTEPQQRMATGKIGGHFGAANGRTWSQLFPVQVFKSPGCCAFNINAEDIIAVSETLGGGYVSWGRHDILCSFSAPASLGKVHRTRISIGEAKQKALSVVPADRQDAVVGGSIRFFDCVGSWYDEYTGDSNFKYTRTVEKGTREQLGVPGMLLLPLGWTMGCERVYSIDTETLSDNKGPVAKRITAISVDQ